MVKYIKKDLLDTDCKYIAHGVNCQNAMGSGVAKALYTKYPEVKSEYHRYCDTGVHRLGATQLVDCGDKQIFNCFTQSGYGREPGRVYMSYEAVALCFQNFRELGIKQIAIPKIGCGLAGGDWGKIEKTINWAVKNDVEVLVHVLED